MARTDSVIEERIINLQFFGNAEDEGRTEKGSSKKREDARKKGQVVKSTELNTAILLVAFFILLSLLSSYCLYRLKDTLIKGFLRLPVAINELDTNYLLLQTAELFKQVLIISVPLWAGLFITGLTTNILQVGYKPTAEPFKVKFDKMDPLKGLKKIVSIETIFTLGISVGKVIVLGIVIWKVVKGEIPKFLKLYDLEIGQILKIIGSALVKVGIYASVAFLLLSILDYFYQKHKYEESIKMSKQEVKDEFKNAEGDPQIKGKMKQKMRESSLKRMMQSIPEADVIITNPTHFAIAIAYDSNKNSAPVVVAKGVDYVARKIKERAAEYHIEIVENKPLARALYYTVDLNQQIPPELYGAVAEVLAFVYGMENKKPQRRDNR